MCVCACIRLADWLSACLAGRVTVLSVQVDCQAAVNPGWQSTSISGRLLTGLLSVPEWLTGLLSVRVDSVDASIKMIVLQIRYIGILGKLLKFIYITMCYNKLKSDFKNLCSCKSVVRSSETSKSAQRTTGRKLLSFGGREHPGVLL